MSKAPKPNLRPEPDHNAREAITYFRPVEDREADWAPLSAQLIRRIFTYTRPYAARRNWLFVLTFARGLQLPALAWMIGQTINGPVASKDLTGIYLHSAIYLGLVLAMITTLHFRQRFALELEKPSPTTCARSCSGNCAHNPCRSSTKPSLAESSAA